MSVLEVNNVSIRYITGDFKDIGLKEYTMKKLKGDYHVTEFWADRNISFTLEKGEMLGIIGTNGAGKSTLLKAVSGIMEPTEGYVKREGNIAALLELASGFDGDLTVRENAYLRGAMLGYTRKFMDETYDQIIDFAELRDFQDRPFRQLSSGMKSRLAFSIASLVQPDILILDEVLSVGDGAFRKKSEAKMREIIAGGAATILVSHSVQQVRELCNKVLWLDHGRQITLSGDVEGICDLYQKFLNKEITLEEAEQQGKTPPEKWEQGKKKLSGRCELMSGGSRQAGKSDGEQAVVEGGEAEKNSTHYMKFQNLLMSGGNGIYVAIFYLVFLWNVSMMISSSIFAGILALPGIFLLRKGEFTISVKKLPILWSLVQIVSLICMLYMAIGLRVDLTWDWGQLIRTASNYVLTGEIDKVSYYARYPNNQFWLVCLIIFFKIVNAIYAPAALRQFKAAAILLSCLMVQISIRLIYCAAKKLFGAKNAFICGCMAALCLPMYLYATFAYTDTAGMMISAAIIYIYTCCTGEKENCSKKLIYIAAIEILAAVALQLKVTIFIVIIAIAICFLVGDRNFCKAFFALGIIAIVGSFTFFGLQAFKSNYIQIDKTMQDQYEFPLTHWVMMGANNYGGFSQKDVDFTMSFPNFTEKKAATTEEAIKRISDYGFVGITKHILNTKLKRTWCNSCLAGDDYVGRVPVKQGILQRIFTEKGDLHWACLIYSWLYHIILIFGCFCSGIFCFKRKQMDAVYMERLALIGIFIFHSIWECNSRYLVLFLPILIIVSMDGWINLKNSRKVMGST